MSSRYFYGTILFLTFFSPVLELTSAQTTPPGPYPTPQQFMECVNSLVPAVPVSQMQQWAQQGGLPSSIPTDLLAQLQAAGATCAAKLISSNPPPALPVQPPVLQNPTSTSPQIQLPQNYPTPDQFMACVNSKVPEVPVSQMQQWAQQGGLPTNLSPNLLSRLQVAGANCASQLVGSRPNYPQPQAPQPPLPTPLVPTIPITSGMPSINQFLTCVSSKVTGVSLSQMQQWNSQGITPVTLPANILYQLQTAAYSCAVQFIANYQPPPPPTPTSTTSTPPPSQPAVPPLPQSSYGNYPTPAQMMVCVNNLVPSVSITQMQQMAQGIQFNLSSTTMQQLQAAGATCASQLISH